MARKEAIEKITDAVREYNGYIAKWKSSGYKGNLPINMLESINALHNTTEEFLEKNRAGT